MSAGTRRGTKVLRLVGGGHALQVKGLLKTSTVLRALVPEATSTGGTGAGVGRAGGGALPSGRALGVLRPPSSISSKANATLWTCPASKSRGQALQPLPGPPAARCFSSERTRWEQTRPEGALESAHPLGTGGQGQGMGWAGEQGRVEMFTRWFSLPSPVIRGSSEVQWGKAQNPPSRARASPGAGSAEGHTMRSGSDPVLEMRLREDKSRPRGPQPCTPSGHPQCAGRASHTEPVCVAGQDTGLGGSGGPGTGQALGTLLGLTPARWWLQVTGTGALVLASTCWMSQEGGPRPHPHPHVESSRNEKAPLSPQGR